MNTSSYINKSLTEKEKRSIANLLAWDSNYLVSSSEVLSLTQIQGGLWAHLSGNRTVSIDAAELEKVVGASVVADTFVKSDGNNRTPVYTVASHARGFLGSVHQSLVDGRWLVNSMYRRDTDRYLTFFEAVETLFN